MLGMNIERPCVVALTWVLKDSLGEELDVLPEPVEFLVGGDDLLPVIEEVLMGHTAGARVDVAIEPEQGFGDYDENLVFLESRALFPPELETGMCLEPGALPPGCTALAGPNALYTVTEIYPEHVVLDGNHPLSGIALRLTISVHGVRAASDDELVRRSAGTGFFTVLPSAPNGGAVH